MVNGGGLRYAGTMDIYHIWFDRADGADDLELADAIDAYLGRLRADGKIEGYRITRRKLGLGLPELGEFHLMIETADLAQLEQAFRNVSSRSDPVENLHAAVIARVKNTRFALYRDFPDEWRVRGEEKF